MGKGKRKAEQGMHVNKHRRNISAQGSESKMKHASRPGEGHSRVAIGALPNSRTVGSCEAGIAHATHDMVKISTA